MSKANRVIEFQLIKTKSELESCCKVCEKQISLAVDTEFDHNSFSYGLTLCLVQIATPSGKIFLIDPLEGFDLAPLFLILQNPKIEKVLHSAGEDLLLFHHLGCFPKNIFDTEKTARLVGEEKTGLADLLFKYEDVKLSKEFQRTNWSVRPLPKEILEYAALDVKYLLHLKSILLDQAENRNMEKWLPIIMEPLSRLSLIDSQKAQKIRIPKEFTKEERKAYTALFRARDMKAKELNKPPYKVVNNETLKNMALRYKGETSNWRNIKGMGPYGKSPQFLDDFNFVFSSLKEEDYFQKNQRRASGADFLNRKRLLESLQGQLTEKGGEELSRIIISNAKLIEMAASGCIEKLPLKLIEQITRKLEIDKRYSKSLFKPVPCA